MSVPFLDLKRQYKFIKDDVESKVIEVMRSCSYIGGKYVKEFEESVRAYIDVEHAISCSNGTDALVLALKACNVGIGDEVITSPFTFFATAEAIASIGAIPVFVDIREDDLNIDAGKIKKKITEKTKAIMPVHIFGFPCDMDAINAIAKEYSVPVIEDAAQAFGCEYKGRKIGSTADISCFSFYPTKNLGAFGDAGLLTTNSKKYADIILALREHGAGKPGAIAREALYGIKDEYAEANIGNELYNPYKYYNYIVGYNSRLNAIQAAVLNEKLIHIDVYNNMRLKIANKYTNELCNTVTTPDQSKFGKPCYHQYVIRTDMKNELVDFLSSRGVATGAFYPVPLHLQKAFSDLGYQQGDMPIAEKASRQAICLPIFPELENSEIDEVIDCIKEFFDGHIHS